MSADQEGATGHDLRLQASPEKPAKHVHFPNSWQKPWPEQTSGQEAFKPGPPPPNDSELETPSPNLFNSNGLFEEELLSSLVGMTIENGATQEKDVMLPQSSPVITLYEPPGVIFHSFQPFHGAEGSTSEFVKRRKVRPTGWSPTIKHIRMGDEKMAPAGDRLRTNEGTISPRRLDREKGASGSVDTNFESAYLTEMSRETRSVTLSGPHES